MTHLFYYINDPRTLSQLPGVIYARVLGEVVLLCRTLGLCSEVYRKLFAPMLTTLLRSDLPLACLEQNMDLEQIYPSRYDIKLYVSSWISRKMYL